MFWPGDDAAKKKYWEAYFARFDNVWTHGDYVQFHPGTGQVMFLGRADGVLNPSGVRFGSAELYSVIEQNFPKEIAESVVVGQRWVHISDGHRSSSTTPLVKTFVANHILSLTIGGRETKTSLLCYF